MGTLRGSQNYIWFETDGLGQGATGAVYKARHKRTGELYAVKTFNTMSQMRPVDVQMREFHVLQKVNHENIVKLLAIEEDSLNNQKVIVMELCTGGSLYTLLEDPTNSFGFPEDEFFTVLEHVASGMEHLNHLGIVHRDIKPGNILLYRGYDGRHIYKLIDFGAARELHEEEQFMSLYGTEEYLFPDMYARAVLRQHVDGKFDASVDLWSLGVTFYHVATGHLPFRPYGGRSNKHTMYNMTSNKDSGVISGVQHEPGGKIEFCRRLPDTCQLSKGAKLMVTPLLAGLMESRHDRMWTFNKFFDQVCTVKKRKLVHVFNTYDCTMLHIYLSPSDRLIQFQEAVANQTDIPSNRQDLVIDHGCLADHVGPMMDASKYPLTQTNSPWLLYIKIDAQFIDIPQFMAPILPPKPSLPSGQPMSTTSDYSHVKLINKTLHYIKNQMVACHQRQKMIVMAAKVFLFILCKEICKIQTYSHQFAVLVEETEKRINWFRVQQNKNIDILVNVVGDTRLGAYRADGDTFLMASQMKLRELIEGNHKITLGCDDYYNRILKDNELDWKHIADYSCKDTQTCLRKIDVLIDDVKGIVTNFKLDSRKRALSHNEEQIHKFEKYKAKANCDKGLLLLSSSNKSCCQMTKLTFKKFTEWFKWSCEVRHQLTKYENHLGHLTDIQSEVSQQMDSQQSQLLEKMERLMLNPDRMENDYVVFNHEDTFPKKLDTRQNKLAIETLNTELANMRDDTEDMKSLLEENTGLLHKVQELLENPSL